MWYPPNAFLPFAMSPPGAVVVSPRRSFERQGYYYHMHEGEETKNPTGRGPAAECHNTPYPYGSFRAGTRSALKGGHHLAREPAQLLLELLRRQALGPVDHEVLEPGILRLDRLDSVDDVRGGAAEPRLLRDAVGEIRHARGRARRAPRAAVLVGVPHEPERREPLVALVVRGLDAPLGLLGRVGKIDAGAPDHVLAELLRTAVLGAGVAVRLHDVVEDLLAVERHHGLEILRRHVVDRLAAGDRHPDLDGQVLGARHARDLAQLVTAVLHGRRHVVLLAVMAERFFVEALQHQLDLLLEQLAVGRLVDDGRAERFDLARVIAAAHTHDHAAVGDDVRHRVVLGEADGMPHRDHVERAAELEPLRLRGEPQRELDQVWEALVALVLEVVLGRPQRVVAEGVHLLGDVFRRPEHLGEAGVGVATGVGGRARQADVLELDLTNVQGVKSLDHRAVHPPSTTSVWPVTYEAASPARNTAEAAISSMVPRRSAGVMAFTAASSPPMPRITGASAPRMRTVLARSPVCTAPGQMALTVIPCAACVMARCFVRPTTPCLLAVYAGPPPEPTRPATEAMLTMRPRRAAAMSTSARLHA